MVLLNSTLNSIPLFFLSFMKMSSFSLVEVGWFEEVFSMGGSKGGDKVYRLKWVDL